MENGVLIKVNDQDAYSERLHWFFSISCGLHTSLLFAGSSMPICVIMVVQKSIKLVTVIPRVMCCSNFSIRIRLHCRERFSRYSNYLSLYIKKYSSFLSVTTIGLHFLF